MIDLLRSIVDGISNIFAFLVHTIQSFINLLMSIPRFTAYIFSLVNSLIPDIFKPFIIIAVIVSIILLILGRNS